MKLNKKLGLLVIVSIILIVAGVFSYHLTARPVSRHELTLLNTTDEHQYILPYDYMDDEVDEEIGLSKIYTLVEEARREFDNTMLLSSGDVIQGSMVGEMEAKIDPLEGHEFQTIIRAFNVMGYDAVAVGNHDVTDFGLDFFDRARENSVFPWLSANIKQAADTTEFYTKPYEIIRHHVDGYPIDVGVIGFVPPQIMNWGRRHLEGEIVVKDILPQAEKYIPELEEKSDIVVVVAHSGIDDSPPDSAGGRENAGYHLAQIDGVDAMVLGHQHEKFPGDFEEMPGIDNEKGLIHGVPAAMASSWGSSLGVIELDLFYREGEWEVNDGNSHLRMTTEDVESHPRIEDIAADIHEETLEYVRTPIGSTQMDITSYFARIKDSPVTQLINDAQLWYARDRLAGTEYEDYPLLSAAAPFIAGREGPGYFTHVRNDINIGDVTDIYIYPNTVEIVKLTGSQLRDYLEHSGRNFETIDPESNEPQHFIDYEMRAFNFDVIEGLEYEYDITKPAGERLASVTHQGEPLADEDEFLVIMNNYRASSGGDFPHMEDENIVISGTDVNREAIINYIEKKGVINPRPSSNWRVKPVETEGELLFRSSPAARDYLDKYDYDGLTYTESADGWGIYRVDFDKF